MWFPYDAYIADVDRIGHHGNTGGLEFHLPQKPYAFMWLVPMAIPM